MKKSLAALADGQIAKHPHFNSADLQRKRLGKALARFGAPGIKKQLDVMQWGVAV